MWPNSQLDKAYDYPCFCIIHKVILYVKIYKFHCDNTLENYCYLCLWNWGSCTAAKGRGRKYIRNRGYGGGVRTSAQATVKSIFKQLSQSWKNLTNAQILAWNALAQTQAGKSVLGTSAKISGANLYSRLNYWIVFCGGEALSNPPALQGVEAPTEAVVTLTPTKFTFELEGEPDNAADLKLIIMASAPQSNGVTRAYGKVVRIAQPLEAVCEEYDIKEDFDNKHGAPNAAAPKTFMKYFFVNTKTGEKSGEMLTLVTLDEDASVEGE